MRLNYYPVEFPGCNITSSFESLFKCPLVVKDWPLVIYHALFAAKNEPITLIPYEILGNLTATLSNPRNSSATLFDQFLNGYADATFNTLYMTEERSHYFTYATPFLRLRY